MNNKARISSMTEVIMLSLLFVALAGIVVTYFNYHYSKDYDIGIDTSAIQQNGSFASYTITAQGQIEGGEVEQVDDGLSLKNSWAIARGITTVTWGVITGAWIPNLISYLMLGSAGTVISTVLRVLFVMTLIFAVVKLFFKVGV